VTRVQSRVPFDGEIISLKVKSSDTIDNVKAKIDCVKANALFVWLISHLPAILFSQNKPATNNQPAVLFSQNKPAPAISHQPNEQAVRFKTRRTKDPC
jgi:hypothetical protein